MAPATSPKKGVKSGKKSPKGSGSATKSKSAESEDAPTGFSESAEDGRQAILQPAPTTVENVVDGLILDDLPDPTVWKEKLSEMIRQAIPMLLSTFVHYASSSELAQTVEAARRMKVAGYRKLTKDLGLASKDVGGSPTKGRGTQRTDLDIYLFTKYGGSNSAELVQLTLNQLLTVLIHLTFFRHNVRYSHLKDGPKEVQVPVVQCMRELLFETLPKLKRLAGSAFGDMLTGDAEAQVVVATYTGKLEEWKATLFHKVNENGSDFLSEFINIYVSSGTIGESSVNVTESNGLVYTHKSSLSKSQVMRAFFDAQGAEAVGFGPLKEDIGVLIEAVARCGDKKYAAVMEMGFAERIEGVIMNLLGEATAMEVIEKATAPSETGVAEGEEDLAKEGAKAQQLEKNWLTAWRCMNFKSLHMYPLWESELYDIIKDAFPQLQLIFQHYCASSIAGSDNISEATCIGLEEMLDFARETGIPTATFFLKDVERQVVMANSMEMASLTGAADRKKLGKKDKRSSDGFGSSVSDAVDKAAELNAVNRKMRAQVVSSRSEE